MTFFFITIFEEAHFLPHALGYDRAKNHAREGGAALQSLPPLPLSLDTERKRERRERETREYWRFFFASLSLC
jgi:hypothetical protein